MVLLLLLQAEIPLLLRVSSSLQQQQRQGIEK
jgi:hypothetical protein